ncbi:hypothetical protein BGW38_004220, partial [Lunasporangiospora selenospora]
VFISLSELIDACLNAILRLQQSELAVCLEDGTCTLLASVILDIGIRVFHHIDRSQVARNRSNQYVEWNQKTLAITTKFFEFAGDTVQQIPELGSHAADFTIRGNNMLLRYAEEAKNEYQYLNWTFKCISKMVPNCEENRVYRLEKRRILQLLCKEIHTTLLDIYATCVDSEDVSPLYISRRSKLFLFYFTHLKGMSSKLFSGICQTSEEASDCRDALRYLLFFLRSRLLSSTSIKINYPAVQANLEKYVGVLEDTIVGGLSSTDGQSEDDTLKVLQEFVVMEGPRMHLDQPTPLSDSEWNVGRVHFILRLLASFDEFSPNIQLQLYPAIDNHFDRTIISRLVEAVGVMDPMDFAVPENNSSEFECDKHYVDILSHLCIFAHLVQPAQFRRLQIDMVGLLLGRYEIWTLISRDWWTCVSERLGPVFTSNQVVVLTELLDTLPLGRVSKKIGDLISSLLLLLDDDAQMAVAKKLLLKIDRGSYTLIASFPFHSLDSPSLGSLIDKCIEGWRSAIDLLGDERLVLETFYSKHQYVNCLGSILAHKSHRQAIPPQTRSMLVIWSVEIITAVQELLSSHGDDERALAKIGCTTESLFGFLQIMQPLQASELVQILETLLSWESLPVEQRPLSRLTIATFLSSCTGVELVDDTQKTSLEGDFQRLYELLFNTPEWIVQYQSLLSVMAIQSSPQFRGWLDESRFDKSVVHSLQMLNRDCDKVLSQDQSDGLWRDWEHAMEGSLRVSRLRSWTVSDLQKRHRAPLDPSDCIQALAVAKQYLLDIRDTRAMRYGSFSQGGDDGFGETEFQHKIAAELATLKKLADLYASPMYIDTSFT